MKSSELAKELGIKSSEIVAEVARLRGVSFKKRTTMINLSAEETEAIRTLVLHARSASVQHGAVPMPDSFSGDVREDRADAETGAPGSNGGSREESSAGRPENAMPSEPAVSSMHEVQEPDADTGSGTGMSGSTAQEGSAIAKAEVSLPQPAAEAPEVAAEAHASPETSQEVLSDQRGSVTIEVEPSVQVALADEPEAEPAIEPESDPEQFPTWHGDRHTLETRHLGKSYGKKTAVRNVSFSVRTGEIVGLLGPNGAGKTTTFYMVVGAIKPDHGEILLNGTDLRAMPMYQRALNGLGYLPQEPSIFRKLTVRENLKAVLEIRHKSERKKDDPLDIDEEVQGVLEEFSLTEFADRDGYRLSGGERRRTEIARAVVLRPTFLLFDEPFAGIDPIAIIELKKMITYLKNKGLGILITDHNVRETLSITDRAYIIKDGTVFAAGDPETLVGNREVREAYLGEDFRLS